MMQILSQNSVKSKKRRAVILSFVGLIGLVVWYLGYPTKILPQISVNIILIGLICLSISMSFYKRRN